MDEKQLIKLLEAQVEAIMKLQEQVNYLMKEVVEIRKDMIYIISPN